MLQWPHIIFDYFHCNFTIFSEKVNLFLKSNILNITPIVHLIHICMIFVCFRGKHRTFSRFNDDYEF